MASEINNIDNIKYEEGSVQEGDPGREGYSEEGSESKPVAEAQKEKKKTEETAKKDELLPKTSPKKPKGPRAKLIDTLDEEEIKKLLSTKQELEEKNKILEEKNKLLLEYEDLLKRKQAEFENYQKRVKREFDETRKYATAELVLDILNTIDNFERAIDSTKSSRDFDALLEGIIIIENQLKNVLEKNYGVAVIDDVGKEFDPTLHDAIMMEESDEYEEDTIIENLQKGYRMHDRIIRPAKVKVAKAVSSYDDSDEKTNDNEGKPSAKGE